MGVNDRPNPHGAHDELLVVAFAAGDLEGADATRAAGLVADCPDCATLLADVRAIAAATAALPGPRRTRDFRLSDADAARLRRTGWRRLLAPLAGPRFAFTQPLAGAIATLGLAGLLVAGAPSLLQGQPTSFSTSEAGAAPQASAERNAAPPPAPSDGSVTSDTGAPLGAAAASPSASAVPSASAAPIASAAPSVAASGGGAAPVPGGARPVASAAPSMAADQGGAGAGPGLVPAEKGVPVESTATTGGPSLLALASLALLVIGVGLFAVRWTARRLERA